MKTIMGYRQIPQGEITEGAVTVDIQHDEVVGIKASVWWPAKGHDEAVKNDFSDIAKALTEAETARVRHGFAEVVVTLEDGVEWQDEWGRISMPSGGREPLGYIGNTDLSDDEAFDLASDIEAERDA